jgi:hypothetical protein
MSDTLSYDPNERAAYPANGRTLSDEVMYHLVSILSNGKVTQDNVGAHEDLLAVFPYLGPPHILLSTEPNGKESM